jgi:serine/threonine protein kinase HipA of HipAB toxin-antitoxin module
MVVMNTSPRKGDAYLKNLGMVHDDSTRPELAPPYDIVTAGAWIPGDLPAIPFGPRS